MEVCPVLLVHFVEVLKTDMVKKKGLRVSAKDDTFSGMNYQDKCFRHEEHLHNHKE